jgi:chemotaxis protein methyltransferase CheR
VRSQRLTIWSAAASSGQEAYSLGLMLLELGMGSWTIDFLGTDLSHRILDRAQTGRYAQIEVNRGLPAPYLVKYFKRHGLEWELPRMLGPFDLVLCRNVLIYFDLETKRKILQSIRPTMNPGGILLLGGSETLLNIDTAFERKLAGAAVCYEKN